MKLKWKTLATGRQYLGESTLGLSINVVMRRVKSGSSYRDVGFVLYIANQTYNTTIMDPDHAMKRAEELYCSIIRDEYNRVCK